KLRRLLDRIEPQFQKGRPLARFHPLYEAFDTFLYTPATVTSAASHVRDSADLKRIMGIVVVSLVGTIVMAIYNTGLQAHRAIEAGSMPRDTWQTAVVQWMGLPFAANDVWACAVHGGLYFVPVLLVTFAVGGAWEALFAQVRRHEINEGFLVTGMLIPLVLPPTVPLWQVALGTSFGVVIGKEIFGGTGMNILNPALTARAFLFFAYPAENSGNVWVAASRAPATPDGYTGATILAAAAERGTAAFGDITWWQAFIGTIPGSMGETSTLACLAGALLLIVTGVGSWRIMTGVTLGTIATTLVLNAVGSTTNPAFEVPFWWHMVAGGWAFGTVYMATDPVSAAQTNTGRWVFGLLVGILAILIRVVNPAYPEGMMLAILFMNVFAPTLDYVVLRANIRRRRLRASA
ncbi:MAG: NADH:ubiquinone reductase (Na(+)-transporting) subunit B, partial [Vicinamibacterales bacterium]